MTFISPNMSSSVIAQPSSTGQNSDAVIPPKGVYQEISPQQDSIHTNYNKLLSTLSRKPVHVAQTFPFDWNGYNNSVLFPQDRQWLTLSNVQSAKRSPLEAATHIIRSGFWGGLFGTITGLLISGIRFRWGIPELLNHQKFLGFLMMPGLPILGGIIGATHGVITATKHHASKFNQAFQNLMSFE